ncbi:glutamate receptor ionotropic, kainate 2-like isoform X8 [Anthonomus grandis grandis]|uniref:glutamate receptor ionotropic, kainate 2-like isoform X8 n=1 Tax=Anthonomus grandis grandis TaxID=2921223 RepID=UPI002165D6DE|nr:glutamate receptor ionotropic, kainate 2-like isoform X8 [Anthonomus grandis grandis]
MTLKTLLGSRFFCLTLLMFPSTIFGLPSVVRIGAIFTENQKGSAAEIAFRYAVYKINRDKTLLPHTSLLYDIQYVPADDSFHASKKACGQVKNGVYAVFGPSDPLLGAHIHSICDALDIPHLEARIDIDSDLKEFSINLYPAQNLLNTAFEDIMGFLNWTKVAIIYEEDYGIKLNIFHIIFIILIRFLGLIKLRELVRAPHNKNLEIHLRQADPESYRTVLKEIKTKEINNIVIDTKPSNMQLFLKGILQLQMNDYKYHYIFTTFDIETFDLEDFKYNFVNMTAFRIVDIDQLYVREVLRDMAKFQANQELAPINGSYIQAEAALIYDSVFVFAIGLQTLEQSHSIKLSNVSCDKEQPWDGGLSLINYINTVDVKGLSGPIEFKEGKRIRFKLDLLKLKQHALVKVGEWHPGMGVNITDRNAFFDHGSMNVTLVVTTILHVLHALSDNQETPYVMMHGSKNYTGNTRFYGFCIDILERVSQEVGFDYLLDLVPDRKYGACDPETGLWNGMVRELMMHKADLAVGSMTINYARESVIDFTKPFMNLGISILFKVPSSPQTRLFSFMNPLAPDIWMYVLSAYILVSITMFVVARFSPYEWQSPHPCDLENEQLKNQFSLANSFWFTIGTLMQQGSDLNPKATSTRIVGGIWWFFTLIIISSYTANLAAFLTVERMITPIENAEDLASQTEIPYGTLESGSTMTFFRDSMIETYKKMWRFMENKKPSVFVPTYEEGIKKVLEGNYAFLMESTMLDYIVQRDCNLTQIGGLLDSKGYGIATPMGSPWRDKISLAILELQEKGEIQMLYDKWWKNTGETCTRNDKSKESKANSLGVDNIGGVFVVLLCGLAFAVIIAIIEFCYNSKKNAIAEKRSPSAPHQSICSEMGGELCFAIRCRGSRQRPALRRQCSKCISGITYVSSPLDIPPHPPQPPARAAPGSNGFSPRVCPSHIQFKEDLPPFQIEKQKAPANQGSNRNISQIHRSDFSN